MNLKCNGQLKVKCNKCGHINTIESDDVFFEVDTTNRSQGVEKCHSSKIEIDCTKCGADISIEYNIWEYPIGIINKVEINIEGGTQVSAFDIEMEE